MTDDNRAMNRWLRGQPADQPDDHDEEPDNQTTPGADGMNAWLRRAAGRTPAPTTPKEGTTP